MDGKKVFEKYYFRLAKEGFLKALVISLIVGFAFVFVMSALGWLFTIKGWLIIAIVGLVAITAALTAILYFKKFKPTAVDIARRVDRLGLRERLITMTELENDDSYIARRQREDALAQLRKVEENRIKLRIPALALVLACVMCFSGLSMSVIGVLADTGRVPGGDEILNPPAPPQLCKITYEAQEGGVIEGDMYQEVMQGENTEMVIAVADEGWMFQEWTDGIGGFARFDEEVQESFTVYAVFVRVADGSGGDGEGEPGDQPPSDDPGDGNGGDGDPNQNPGHTAGGSFEEGNYVENNDIYYRDIYDQYYDAAMEYLASGSDVPADLRAIIEAYFGIIL